MGYHDEAFALLGRRLRRSRRAEARLSRLDLPPSIREWYAHAGAARILGAANADRPVDAGRLGEADDRVRGRRLLLMEENQGVCLWAARLGGSDDPPVEVSVDSGRWIRHADRFSTFVWTRIFDTPGRRLQLTAQEAELDRRDLRRLCRSFSVEPRTRGWPGRTSYRFAGPRQRILLWESGNGGVDWNLLADTATALADLARRAWACGHLATTLRGVSAREELVLTRL